MKENNKICKRLVKKINKVDYRKVNLYYIEGGNTKCNSNTTCSCNNTCPCK